MADGKRARRPKGERLAVFFLAVAGALIFRTAPALSPLRSSLRAVLTGGFDHRAAVEVLGMAASGGDGVLEVLGQTLLEAGRTLGETVLS